jgi:predicted ribosome quality control (RQC) complex YloA/Tae2 family protein
LKGEEVKTRVVPMHRSYFLFERQVFHLNQQLKAAVIIKCFTHRKDELVVQCETGQSCFLRIGLQHFLPYLITDSIRNIKEPSFDFFEPLWQDKIMNFTIKPFDKRVTITCENYLLQCRFYGTKPNVILTDTKGNLLSSFKKFSEQPSLLSGESDAFIRQHPDLSAVDRHKITQPAGEFFIREIGGFNNTLSKELFFRVKLNPETPLCNLAENEWLDLLKLYNELIRELEDGRVWLYEHTQKAPVLSPLPLRHLPVDYSPKVFSDTNQAWKQFLFLHQQKHQLQRQLQQSLSAINKKIDYLRSSLKKISDFNQLEEKKKLSELKGHLLQTFASDIAQGTDQVKLKNIFSAAGEKILIKLNPALSIHENAKKYFEKYKNIVTIKADLNAKRDTYQHELRYWQDIYHDAVKIDNLKKAEKLTDLLEAQKLVQTDSPAEKNQKPDTFSFNRLLLDQKWEILIGKNARNNDILTFKFAHKYDIWLHAQGVPGSHVIIHLKDKNRQPPSEIVEKAASIAAFFSNAKTSATVPVNYTNVRYVRKPRNAAAGIVTISHEKTIFVEPKKYL